VTDSDRKPPLRGITRRRLLTRGAAVGAAGLVGGVMGFPYINRMAARAQGAPLKFWQFYAPGGGWRASPSGSTR
jgi:multiple sugar transport system substrate-binding protein